MCYIGLSICSVFGQWSNSMQDTLVSCWPSRNVAVLVFCGGYLVLNWFQWPWCLKHGSAAIHLLGYGYKSCCRNGYLSVVSTVCCLCVGLIACAESPTRNAVFPSVITKTWWWGCPSLLGAVVPLSFGCAGNWMKFYFTKLPLKGMHVCMHDHLSWQNEFNCCL